jgi:hypothetical protein
MQASPALQLLDRFADAFEANGIAAVPADLFNSLVSVARRVDVSPIALEVLVDSTAPEVVRERAYSKVAIQVVGRTVGPSTVATSVGPFLPSLVPA